MIRQYKYEEVSGNDLFLRTQMPTNVEDIVSDIIADIKENGDEALRLYSRKFDDLGDAAFEVCREEIDAAYDRLDPALRETLEKSAANIRNFHKHQVRSSFIVNDRPGVVLGQKILPIEKVGIYVPGGTAAYPSTVLMNGIPASIAGCSQIIMVTPAKSGVIKDSLLAAAKINYDSAEALSSRYAIRSATAACFSPQSLLRQLRRSAASPRGLLRPI